MPGEVLAVPEVQPGDLERQYADTMIQVGSRQMTIADAEVYCPVDLSKVSPEERDLYTAKLLKKNDIEVDEAFTPYLEATQASQDAKKAAKEQASEPQTAKLEAKEVKPLLRVVAPSADTHDAKQDIEPLAILPTAKMSLVSQQIAEHVEVPSTSIIMQGEKVAPVIPEVAIVSTASTVAEVEAPELSAEIVAELQVVADEVFMPEPQQPEAVRLHRGSLVRHLLARLSVVEAPASVDKTEAIAGTFLTELPAPVPLEVVPTDTQAELDEVMPYEVSNEHTPQIMNHFAEAPHLKMTDEQTVQTEQLVQVLPDVVQEALTTFFVEAEPAEVEAVELAIVTIAEIADRLNDLALAGELDSKEAEKIEEVLIKLYVEILEAIGVEPDAELIKQFIVMVKDGSYKTLEREDPIARAIAEQKQGILNVSQNFAYTFLASIHHKLGQFALRTVA